MVKGSRTRTEHDVCIFYFHSPVLLDDKCGDVCEEQCILKGAFLCVLDGSGGWMMEVMILDDGSRLQLFVKVSK